MCVTVWLMWLTFTYYSHTFTLYYYTFSFLISHQRNTGHTNLAVLVFATLNNIMFIKASLKLMSFAAYNFVPNRVTNSPIGTNNLTPYFQKPNICLYIYITKRNMDFTI